jgi:hypothetical protein
MKHRTATLEGALLDAAVAICEGYGDAIYSYGSFDAWAVVNRWNPSTDWGTGGPIIERAEIDLQRYGREVAPSAWEWSADAMCGRPQYGPTALVAVCRAYVASKLGPEVELP